MVGRGTGGALGRSDRSAAPREERALRALLRQIDGRIEAEADAMARRVAVRRTPRPSRVVGRGSGGSPAAGRGGPFRLSRAPGVVLVQGIVSGPPEVAVGFLPAQLPHLRRLFGRPLTSPGISRLASIWRATARPGDAATLTRDNSRGRFDLHRRRFWAAVRRDPQARRLFTDAGLTFGPRPTTAPYRILGGAGSRRLTVSVDHIVERQRRPSRALDPANLRLSPRRENTVLLRQITERNRRYHGIP